MKPPNLVCLINVKTISPSVDKESLTAFV